MNKFSRLKKSKIFSRKSYYAALVICLAMVGLACYFSYKQTANKLSEQLDSVSDDRLTTSVTKGSKQTKAVDVIEKQAGVKKQPAVTTAQTENTVTSATEATPEAVQNHQERVFSIPLNGEILQDFSGSELVKNQTTGAWQTHNGVDIAGNAGDEVKAMTDGTVTDVIEDPLWGIVVVIDHNSGILGRYCSLNKGVTVEKGTKVEAGDVIGAIGNTADIESCMDTHLHFEVLKSENYVNPIDVINNMG